MEKDIASRKCFCINYVKHSGLSLLQTFTLEGIEANKLLRKIHLSYACGAKVNFVQCRYIAFSTIKVHGDRDKKSEIFVKYWTLYLHNTDCKTVCPNATENPLF